MCVCYVLTVVAGFYENKRRKSATNALTKSFNFNASSEKCIILHLGCAGECLSCSGETSTANGVLRLPIFSTCELKSSNNTSGPK